MGDGPKTDNRSRTASLVASAMMRGEDPAQALVDHDLAMAHEEHPGPGPKPGRLCKPGPGEGGASREVVAGHRVASALETVEVSTTLDYLLRHANNRRLGVKVLEGAERVLNHFLRLKELPAADDGEAPVRVREFEAVAKMVMKFYADAREVYIKRQSNEVEAVVDVTKPDEVFSKIAKLADEAGELRKLLAAPAAPEDADALGSCEGQPAEASVADRE